MDIIDGVFVNAGDVDLYIKVLGEGNPPIIIEPGIGGLSVEWYIVQKELANITTVVTYDRAGYGESPKSKLPRTSFTIANQLFNLLFNSEVEHPYILLGHSEGGLYVQHFASLFHHYVAGVILVDSLFDDYFRLESEDYPSFNTIVSYSTRINNLSKLIGLEKEDFTKKMLHYLQELYDGFPDEFKVPMIAYQSDKKFFEVVMDEMKHLKESLNELQQNLNLPDIPLAVISHDPSVMKELSVQIGIPEEEAQLIENFWLEKQKKLSRLAPRGEFYIALNSDRNIHYSNPLFIVEIAKKMVEHIRRSDL